MNKIVNKLCKELDVEYLFDLPDEIQDLVYGICKSRDTGILSEFYVKFMDHKYKPDLKLYETINLPLIYSKGEIMTKKNQLDLEKKLNKSTCSIDVFHEGNKDKFNFYSRFTSYLDQFKQYIYDLKKQTGLPFITNAWVKCWEMLIHYKLIPENHSSDFTVFCNAEFPGAFIFAIDHYMKTKTKNKKYKWYGNSLWPGSTKEGGDNILGDDFGLYKKYKKRWLMNKDKNGDVTSKEMNDYIKSILEKKVDLYTSDIGINVPFEREHEKETLEAHLNLGQIICALNTLKEGGHMVCKTFLFFKPMTMSLLYLLSSIFDEFSISKPMTSRPGNSEIYLIGKGYKRNDSVTKILEDILYSWDVKYMNEWIVPISKEFYLEIVLALYEIYNRQIYFVDKNVELVKNEYEKAKVVRDRDGKYIRLVPQEKHFLRESKKEFDIRVDIVTEWLKNYDIGIFDRVQLI